MNCFNHIDRAAVAQCPIAGKDFVPNVPKSMSRYFARLVFRREDKARSGGAYVVCYSWQLCLP